MSTEEQKDLAAIERLLGRTIERSFLPAFDYGMRPSEIKQVLSYDDEWTRPKRPAGGLQSAAARIAGGPAARVPAPPRASRRPPRPPSRRGPRSPSMPPAPPLRTLAPSPPKKPAATPEGPGSRRPSRARRPTRSTRRHEEALSGARRRARRRRRRAWPRSSTGSRPATGEEGTALEPEAEEVAAGLQAGRARRKHSGRRGPFAGSRQAGRYLGSSGSQPAMPGFATVSHRPWRTSRTCSVAGGLRPGIEEQHVRVRARAARTSRP